MNYLLKNCDILKVTLPIDSSLKLFILQHQYYHLKQVILYLNVLPLFTEYHVNNCIKLLLNEIHALLSLRKTSEYQNQIFERQEILENHSQLNIICHLQSTREAFQIKIDGWYLCRLIQLKNTSKLHLDWFKVMLRINTIQYVFRKCV